MSWKLLLADRHHSWTNWIQERSFPVTLDLCPSSARLGPPGCVRVLRHGETTAWGYVGSTQMIRSPLRAIQVVHRLHPTGVDGGVVLLEIAQNSPVVRELHRTITQFFPFASILAPEGGLVNLEGWPIGPETVELPPELPQVALQAQRRSRWIELLDSSNEIEVDLRRIDAFGSRFRSGQTITVPTVLYAELNGSTLYLVAENSPEEAELLRLMDKVGAMRSHVTRPTDFEGVIVSFAHENGMDFVLGRVKSLDLASLRATIQIPAESLSSARSVFFGLIRIDEKGREMPEHAPWTL